jgi:hypothetical protein
MKPKCELCGKEVKEKQNLSLFTKPFNPFGLIPVHKDCLKKAQKKRGENYKKIYSGRIGRRADKFPVDSIRFNIILATFLIGGYFVRNSFEYALVIYVLGIIIFGWIKAQQYYFYYNHYKQI